MLLASLTAAVAAALLATVAALAWGAAALIGLGCGCLWCLQHLTPFAVGPPACVAPPLPVSAFGKTRALQGAPNRLWGAKVAGG